MFYYQDIIMWIKIYKYKTVNQFDGLGMQASFGSKLMFQ